MRNNARGQAGIAAGHVPDGSRLIGAVGLPLCVVMAACDSNNNAPLPPGGGNGGNGADLTPPAITLNGSPEETVALGSAWEDPGAIAVDDVDGAVPVASDGEVDTGEAGLYRVTYSASDSAGNEARIFRFVRVGPVTRTLRISSLGEGRIDLAANGQDATCSDDCEFDFAQGTFIELTAVGLGDGIFDEWESCNSYDGDTCSLTLDNDRVVHATFASRTPVEFFDHTVFLDEAQMRAIRNYDPASNELQFDPSADLEIARFGDGIVSVTGPNLCLEESAEPLLPESYSPAASGRMGEITCRSAGVVAHKLGAQL